MKNVNLSTEDFWSELESQLQIDPTLTSKQYRKFDIERAKKAMSAIGKAGEKIIDSYLSSLVDKKVIASYIWENNEKESGLPYDFSYKTLDGKTVYLDVKTTGHRFKQKMIFSSQEVDFIANNTADYCIYRVYCDKNGNFYLRTCSNSKELFEKLKTETIDYIKSTASLATIGEIKMAISPTQKELIFGDEIMLPQAKDYQQAVLI